MDEQTDQQIDGERDRETYNTMQSSLFFVFFKFFSSDPGLEQVRGVRVRLQHRLLRQVRR
jgi:hypothetical protein